MTRVRIATWNMHGGVGLDGRFDPDRIARVIGELDADIVALQEFHSRGSFDMHAHLGTLGFEHVIVMPTFRKRGSEFGNAVLTRSPARDAIAHPFGVGNREPRNAIDLRVVADECTVRVIATHLGLRSAERRIQVARLLALIGPSAPQPVVLLGDFNEWSARGALAPIDLRFGRSAAPRTFPSPYPLAALDRIWIDPPSACVDLCVHRSRTSRVASDHLPLVATLDLP
jgi:endonuclease/exonuclease/phosphatase family metal-dependent hydrolase